MSKFPYFTKEDREYFPNANKFTSAKYLYWKNKLKNCNREYQKARRRKYDLHILINEKVKKQNGEFSLHVSQWEELNRTNANLLYIKAWYEACIEQYRIAKKNYLKEQKDIYKKNYEDRNNVLMYKNSRTIKGNYIFEIIIKGPDGKSLLNPFYVRTDYEGPMNEWLRNIAYYLDAYEDALKLYDFNAYFELEVINSHRDGDFSVDVKAITSAQLPLDAKFTIDFAKFNAYIDSHSDANNRISFYNFCNGEKIIIGKTDFALWLVEKGHLQSVKEHSTFCTKNRWNKLYHLFSQERQ